MSSRLTAEGACVLPGTIVSARESGLITTVAPVRGSELIAGLSAGGGEYLFVQHARHVHRCLRIACENSQSGAFFDSCYADLAILLASGNACGMGRIRERAGGKVLKER